MKFSLTQQNTLRNILMALCVSALFVSLPFSASAQFNPEINYQGKLTNASGVAVPDGLYNINFWLVPTLGGATSTAVWSEARTSGNRVQVTNGLFSVMLGDVSSLASVDFNQTLYLGVEIGGISTTTPAWDGEMSPRKILGAVPAAFVAETASSADSLSGIASSSFLRSDEADTMQATSSSPILSIIQNGAGAVARFFSGVTEVFTLLNNGNVGVGTSTPSSRFTVSGNSYLAGDLRLTGALRDGNNASGTLGMILQATGTTTRWTATSSLGLGNGTYLGLSDTQSSFTANRVIYTNSGATALTDSANFTFDGTNLGLGGNSGITVGGNMVFLASTTRSNYMIGHEAGLTLDTASDGNTFVGHAAGFRYSGDNSVFLGRAAGYGLGGTYTANEVVAIGNSAGISLGDGADNNVLVGSFAGEAVTTGANNLILGHRAADNLTTGSSNIVIGYDIDVASTTRSNQLNIGNLIFGTGLDGVGTIVSTGNVGIGTSTPGSKLTVAGDFAVTGNVNLQNSSVMTVAGERFIHAYVVDNTYGSNQFMGYQSGNFTLGSSTNPFLGIDNLGVGRSTLSSLTTGSDNTAVGQSSLQFTTTGSNNTAMGRYALQQNISGSSNTAIGNNALLTSTSSSNNTAVGNGALSDNTLGQFNTALGSVALVNNTIGELNTAIGYDALGQNTEGNYNVAIGPSAVASNQTGWGNIGIGYYALNSATGSNNVAVGRQAGINLAGGNNNTFIGDQSGSGIVTGSFNTIIGADLTGLPAGLSNNIIIADGQGNRRINVNASGNVGIGTTSPIAKLDVWGGFKVGTSSRSLISASTTANQVAFGAGDVVTDVMGVTHLVTISGNSSVGAEPTLYLNEESIGSTDTGRILFGRSSIAGGRTIGLLDFENGASIEVVADAADEHAGSIRISTNAPGAGPGLAEHLRLTSGGNLGLGTTTPASKLTVAGDLRLTGAFRDASNASGTLGMVLQSTGTSTRWVATSTLGISGASTFLSLTDTPSSYTANRIMYTNSGATALIDSADLTFDGTNLGLGSGDGIAFNGVRYFTASSSGAISIGEGAGAAAVSNSHNIAIGFEAARNASFTQNNIAIGRIAGRNALSVRNVMIGDSAGATSTGTDNNIIGTGAGELQTGSDNNIFGRITGINNTGSFNNLIGYGAGSNQIGSYNNSFGYQAGNGNTGSSSNLFGYQSGFSNDGDFANLIGQNAGRNNQGDYVNLFGFEAGATSTGAYNNFIGYRAGADNSGTENNFIGYQAGRFNTGTNNNILGNSAGYANTGTYNNLLGVAAGEENEGDSVNLLGYRAGQFNSGDDVNSFGYESGRFNIGTYNNFLGAFAGSENSGSAVNAFGLLAASQNEGTGVNALGVYAGYENTGSTTNLIGSFAGYNNSGDFVDAIGAYAGYNNSGSYNSFVGYSAGATSTGTFNLGLGYLAAGNNSGSFNNIFGYVAGRFNTGSNNNILGLAAGRDNTGSQNNMIGQDAGHSNSGSLNNMFGLSAGQDNTGSSSNLFGYQAGYSNTGDYVNLFGENAGRNNSGDYNNFIGFNAGATSTGSYNNAFGYFAGASTTGQYNNTLGYDAGRYNTGSNNNFLGREAGQSNTGSENNFFGTYAGRLNIGSYNNMFGRLAGDDNTGSYNNLFGVQAGNTNTGSSSNLFGYRAGRNNTGDYVNLIGEDAGLDNTGDDNNIFGRFAGQSNTGSFNNIMGQYAGLGNSGQYNNIIGQSAGEGNSGGLNNLIGFEAGQNNQGSYNNIFGDNAGQENIGSHNNLFGYYAGEYNEGDYNNFFGREAGQNSSTGSYNNFFGYGTGYFNTGSYNEFIGANAGRNLQGTSSVIIGADAFRGAGVTAFTAINNTVIGFGAGYNATNTANNNILLGYQAADNLTTGNNNIIIGYDIDNVTATADNRLNIGNLIFGTGLDGTGTTLASGNIGIGTSTPASKLSVAGDLRLTGAFRDGANASGTLGMVLQSTGTSTRWVATSTLGISGGGASTFLALTDTPSSYTANRIMYTNSGATALVDSANFTYNGTDLGLGGSNGIAFGGTRVISASTTLSNYIFGDSAGASITTGGNNILLGSLAGEDLANGGENIFIGSQAGRYMSSGSFNQGIGGGALRSLGNGSDNVALGYVAGFSLVGGSSNSFVGSSAGNLLVAGNDNAFLGGYAGRYIATSSGSVAVGAFAADGTSNYQAQNFTILGAFAGQNMQTGADNNIIIGHAAANNLTTGNNNIIIGYDIDSVTATADNRLNIGNLIFGTGLDGTGTTLASGNVGIGTSTPGSKLTIDGDIAISGDVNLGPVSRINVAGERYIHGYTLDNTYGVNQFMGFQAGNFTSGSSTNPFLGIDNLGIGRSSLSALTEGSGNTGVGYSSLSSVTTAIANTALGTRSLFLTTSGGDNVAVGSEAMYNNTTGYRNIAVGSSALYGNETGDSNVAVGYRSLFNNIIGSTNVGVGNETLHSATSSGSNTAVGHFALRLVTASNNTALGAYAGSDLTLGTYNTIVGDYTGLGLTTGSHNTIIGANVIGLSSSLSNNIIIADGQGNRRINVTSNGNTGIGTTSPSAKLDVWGSFKIGTSSSPLLFADTAARQLVIGTSSVLYESINGDVPLVAMVNEEVPGRLSMFLLREQSVSQFASGRIQFEKALNFGDSFIGEIAFHNAGSIAAVSDVGDAIAGSLRFATDGPGLGVLEERMRLTSTGNLGIGTTTPRGRLGMENLSFSSTSTVAGIDQYFSFNNSVANAALYGNRTYLHATNTATTTIIGSITRVADSTTFGNTVRGLEVQADNGNNTRGENTGIAGFGRTFGVRGTTVGDAGGTFEPAGIYGETEGTTQGNAIRGYSSSITTAALLKLFQDTSTFTGTGLLMNFGNAGGSFSSTTASRFIDLQNGGTSRFSVGAYGMTTIGDGTTSNNAGLRIGYGGLCVDNDGSCNASTTGRISAVSYHTGNSDLAETYFSSDDLKTGEVVYLKGDLSIGRASEATEKKIIGVVTTKPGLLLGFDDTSLRTGEDMYGVALAGRVPVRLSNENGEIKAGDELMLSSIPGVAMKASSTGTVVGIALEDFEEGRAYSDTYINQFGDDLVDPVVTPINPNNDPRVNDGCYYGAGSASGDAPCVPLVGTTTDAQAAEAQALAEAEAQAAALAALKNVQSESVTLENGEIVRVGQVVMFVSLDKRYLDEDGIAMVAALLAAGEGADTDSENGTTDTVWNRLVNLANNFIDGVLSVLTLRADRVEVTEELCVDGVCLNADDIRQLLDGTTPTTPEPDDEVPEEEEGEEEGGGELPPPPTEENDGDTGTSTDDGTEDEEGQSEEYPTEEENVEPEVIEEPEEEESAPEEESGASTPEEGSEESTI